ncbi:hypothetical protein RclHR1_39150001 [Rhizophagus clarus]|uniref:Uncharacterized protein n=1 Tax=Rhizophagus clarus TaxID=94130 RepID=A0A2Z6S879_9GLOM|nr:hypothetical protein RclHR1_39150001 [Rhizophagus clarus]
MHKFIKVDLNNQSTNKEYTVSSTEAATTGDKTGDRLLFLGPSLVLSSVSTSTRLRHFDSFDYVEIESVIDVDEGNESEIKIDIDENENDRNDEGSEIDIDENENDENDERSENDENAIVENNEKSESDGNTIIGIQNDNNEI